MFELSSLASFYVHKLFVVWRLKICADTEVSNGAKSMGNKIDLFMYGSCGALKNHLAVHSIVFGPLRTAIYGTLQHLSDEHSDTKIVLRNEKMLF